MALKISNDLRDCVRDIFFPIGSLYMNVTTANPNTLFGGTWVKIASNLTLMSASSDAQLNTTALSGLPDITGSFDPQWSDSSGGGVMFYAQNNGALYTTRPSDRGYWWAGVTVSGGAGSNTQYHTRMNLQASRSNSIYGRSSIVQPPALYSNIWRRTA